MFARMRDRDFGPTGVSLPLIGQGTWNMEGDERADCVAALRRGLDLGLTHVDTAELYGDGAVEEIVGEAIAGRRDEVYLVSKVLPQHATRKGTVAACEASLRRLGTDRLDLYLLHWPGDHPLEGTLVAMQQLQAAGKIVAYGVSNFDADELDEAVAIAGPGEIACNQVLYHLGERAIEHEIVARAAADDVAIVAYSPFGSGEFPDLRKGPGRVLADIAREVGATPRQVALAFLVREENVFAIPKAARVAHVEDNAGAGELVLPAEAIARIDAAFPRGRKRSGVPMI
jgi:diketogulonate reductase-like aldo/keto reductase